MKNTEDILKLKELIIAKEIDIKSLDKVELEALIDHEYEMMDENRFDDQFLNLCLQELDRFTDTSFIKKIDADAIIDNAWHIYNKEAAEKTTQKPAFGFKRVARILIAAAVLAALLTVSAVASWNPFSKWFADIHDILDVERGEVIENEHGSFTSDNFPQNFSSIEEMENELGLEFDVLDTIPSTPSSICITQQGSYKEVWLEYQINKNKVLFTIYLENAPYYKEPLEEAGWDKQTFCNLEWHLIVQDFVTLVCFDNNYVYVISSDSLDTLKTLMEGK